jgi:hypothetical protein
MSTQEEQAQKQTRTPFSVKLPQVALDAATEIATALGELGTASTPHVIGQHMGVSYATNARMRTKLGAAGYFGLIEKQGDKRALTPRGEAIIGDDAEAAERARREAVMSTNFGPILYSLRGRTINDGVIKLRLQSDYNVPENSAPTVATALIESAAQAGLSSNGALDAKVIEHYENVLPKEDDAPTPQHERRQNGQATTSTPKPKPEQKRTPEKRTPEKQPVTTKEVEVERRPFVPGVQVVVKIDATQLGPQEIAELVRALQAPAPLVPESSAS